MGHAFKARVENGRFVIDERTNLPDGCEVELVVVNGDDDLSDEERALLHRELEASMAEADRGELFDAREVLAEITSRP